jgi:4-hydroxyacetophenone monooxygenase
MTSTVRAFDATDEQIDLALREAQLPALLPALAHLTGDLTILREHLRPDPQLASQEQSGLTPEQQAEIREIAGAVLRSYRDGLETRPCSRADLVRIMSFAAGTDVGGEYVPLMLEELSVTGDDLRRPTWRTDEIAPNRPFHVVVIGSGMSGILVGHRLEQAGVSFEILEKNPDVGGTWLENTYPGCRVDSSNHVYSYSFAQRHDWPYHFSTQDVLLDYFRTCADTFGLRERTTFHTEVETVTWRDDANHWDIEVRDTRSGVRRTVQAHAVISAVGQLNRPTIPTIAGADTFVGPAFHSAQWQSDVDLRDMRVAVIGTGASAIQLVPEVAKIARSVAVFQRTPTWLFPVPHYHEQIASGFQWLLEHVPGFAQWYRFTLFWRATEGVLPSCVVDPDWDDGGLSVSAANRELRDLLTMYIEFMLGDRPDLLEKSIPQYAPASKRIVLDNGSWLETLKRDNVQLITDGINSIDGTGIVTASGDHIDADVIIYATGFDAANFLTPMKVIGAEGRDLHEEWNGDARAFLGITVPGFPNFFCMYGPNTNIVVNGSIIYFSECEAQYIVGCVKMMLENDLAAIDVRREVHDSFNERVDQGNKQMAWGVATVNSWYRNATGRVAQNWPFSLLEYWELTRHPVLAEYETKVLQ